MRSLCMAGAAALVLAGCADPAETPAPAQQTEAGDVVMLTAEEQAAGWRLLFNGRDFTGWRVYRGGAPAEPWRVEDGAIMLAGGGGGGDIVTDEEFGPFELSLEWRISPGGNSGVIYLVKETEAADTVWRTGPEYQVLDDDAHPDGRIPSHRSGALFDFAEPLADAVNPVGEWNETRIVFTGDRIEHWLNGRLTAESSYGDDAWRAAVSQTKFRDMPLFGTFSTGRIALQDHGDPVWYRNIRIRPLQEG